MTPTPLIHRAMVNIMRDIDPVAKDRKAGTGVYAYAFRGIDDIYAAVQSVLVTHGVYTTSTVLSDRHEERTTKSGANSIYRVLVMRYTFWCAEDGSSVATEVVGEGMDSGDKASNKAMSVAQKYAFIQAFSIPTSDAKDPENDHHGNNRPAQTQNFAHAGNGGGRHHERPLAPAGNPAPLAAAGAKPPSLGPQALRQAPPPPNPGINSAPSSKVEAFDGNPHQLKRIESYLGGLGRPSLLPHVAELMKGKTMDKQSLQAALAQIQGKEPDGAA